MSPSVKSYGQWESPITGESFTARFVTLSQVRIDGADTYWVEGHPTDNGRNVLLRRNGMGQTMELLPMIDGVRLPDVRTRVHGYGGRAYAVHENILVFSDGFDDRVYLFDMSAPTVGLTALTPMEKKRYGDFEIDEVRSLVYAVCEDHTGQGEPVNTMVAIPLDGSAARDPKPIRTVFSGTDFCSAPTLSPDGSKLAWLSWNHPHMPWTQSVLHVGALTFEGDIDTHVTLVDREGVCVYEPRWTLRGDLIHVDDSSGWANLYRTEGFEWHEDEDAHAWTDRLRTRVLHPGQRAFSHPHWELGLHSYDNLDHEHLICSWSQDHTWHVGSVRLDNGLLEEWETGWWPIGNVASDEGRVVFLADSPTHAPAIVEITDSHAHVLRPSSEAEIAEEMISTAQTVRWTTSDGNEADGFYYAPVNPDFTAPDGELPPLIVSAHGGPTSSARPGLSIARQFWTTRGFAFLDVNYRGSTGSGREYREALNGQWGIIDVMDCADGARYLIDQGLVDPARVAIRGHSAGGFTALSALATTDVFTAGTSSSGVSDLHRMAQETHKFESHYFYTLLGSDNLDDPVWTERSPICHVQDIHAPLLLLQGTEDTIVLPSQSRSIYDALRELDRPVALVEFDGEGHSLRTAASIAKAWASELGFYATVWGFHADGAAEISVTTL
ncbi:alpha/beta hydrolase family protein [Schaalia radingae]|uniref:Dipeptidyl aminopeptidase/acylaminoacyl peptidase n=1 Tax=Schaalia radingae TaxID=131110 RepID=A0ABY0V756_9ACTO|nr:prolyl oligopeptidase family serine peptidase [Schaalia radingae]SDT92676.1 Dipeptidyl aminopeptidase/acylaminoacyl peptidase [Schaalia radingae]